MWAYIAGPDGSSDSFWVSVDGGNVFSIKWFMTTTASFAWDRVMDNNTGTDPWVFNFTQGHHTLTFRTREDGASIDAIEITNILSGFTPGPNSCTPSYTKRVNAGGSAFTDPDGNAWEADSGFNAGSTASTGDAIANTNNDTLYQSERYGTIEWAQSLPNGSYTVNLHYAETYQTGTNQRVFDVFIEGTQVTDDLDLFALVGHDVAYVTTHQVTVSDGQLNVLFVTVTDNAKISGIEVIGN